MVKAVDIGTRKFTTQKAALGHFREMLHRYNDGDVINSPEDHADLVALIERYDFVLDRAGEPLKGQGQIKHFERRRNPGPGWSSHGFWVVREDGSDTDFSYIHAVKGKTANISHDFAEACRVAVAGDLMKAKKNAFKQYADNEGRVPCEISNQMVTFKEAHLDHAWPYFGHLVSGFRATRGWADEIPEGVVSEPSDRQTTASFVDASVAEAFREYHNSQAILRILSKSENQRKASLARRPKPKIPIQIEY